MRLVVAVAFALLLAPAVKAQASADGWVRAQSDSKELSLELPSNSVFFTDKQGFIQSKPDSGSYELKNMMLVNTVINGTLLSVEIYEAPKGAIDQIMEEDKSILKGAKASKATSGRTVTRELSVSKNSAFFRRQYLYSKKFIYIVSAGSRDGGSIEMKRFFDSIRFTPDAAHDAGSGSVAMSSLPQVGVMIDMAPPSFARSNTSTVKKPATPDIPLDEKFIVLLPAKPSYVDAARQNGTTGTMTLSVTFEPNGYVSKILVHKAGLANGLSRQVLCAVLRMKFLPPLSGPNALRPVRKMVEYSFSLY
jgi:TonB family protein